MSRSSRGRRLAAGLVSLAAALGLALPAAASAQIYWANEGGSTIGRAGLDGSGASSFITGATAPSGVAIDGSFLYWSHDAGPNGSIGRAALGGSGVDQTFIATEGPPEGVAVDNSRIYWTQTIAGSGWVGRATVTGFVLAQDYVPLAAGAAPCGLASDADEVFWANSADPGSIGHAHGVDHVEQDHVTATDQPCGVARAGEYLYWTNMGDDTIGRAGLDGSNPEPDFIELNTTSGPCGIAVDGNHVYWSSAASNAVGRAGLDGAAVHETFITGASVQAPCGIAVVPTQGPAPAAHSFAPTPVGERSQVQSFYVANEGSSVLATSEIGLVGADSGDFELTGDSCSVAASPAGAGCTVNVRFAPSGAQGPRTASLRVASNASNSPAQIPLTGLATAPLDKRPPRILAASIVPRAFVPRKAARSTRSLAARGATFRYRLSEAAKVVFTIRRKARGGAGLRRVARFARAGRAGVNRSPFSGRARGRALRAGPFSAKLVAIDAAGNRSDPRFVRFRVLG
jgi:virginiamycin B lyase